ncbi:hypothetical protein EII17_09625 [Clostridiales bacterium COT073_COT-073]|nr:hypothetical protein EII17_09625 [Clostridiales bacterium COT073_COT-073]
MKKRLSVIFGLCLILSTVTIQATTIPDSTKNQELAGQILQELDIIKGTEQGLEEGKPLNREQAIVILIRMLGLEKEAQAFVAYGQFTDVPLTHWAVKYVDFAYQKGLTNGIGNNLFGAGQPVNRKIMATYMLRALAHTADWEREDIMAKARMQGITVDAGDGLEGITRGQAFIYMTNTLEIPQNGNTGMILGNEDLKRYRDKLSKAQFEKPNSTIPNPPKVDTPKVFKAVQLPPSLKPIAAKTYLYDELEVQFNTMVASPSKNNFEFTVDGRRIEDAYYNISPGGASIRFKFSNQNLHGKTIICRMTGLKAFDGKSVISDSTVKAEFKDFTPIKFVQGEVLNNKSFKGILSINVMPPDGHKKGAEGHEVYSDGKLMQEKVDYDLSWGGKEFKVVFKNPEVYPTKEARLKVWGYMTSPYHKFMDEADELVLDFSAFEKKEIPLPEVEEPKPAEIVVDPPKIDVIEMWKDVPVVEQPKDKKTLPATPEPEQKYAEAKQDTDIKAQPIVVTDYRCGSSTIDLYTDGKIGSVEGLRVVDANQKEVKVRYQLFEVLGYDGTPCDGFEIIPEGEDSYRNFAGYTIYVEKLYESTGQVYTGPFSITITGCLM